MSGHVTMTFSERLWAKIDIQGPHECWPWIGKSKTNFGYGRIAKTGRRNGSVVAHRAVYELVNGHIDPDLQVLHSCDNPPCCNPAHLSQGTRLENQGQMVARGRHNPVHFIGTTNPMAVLTEDQVKEIRRRYIPRVVTQRQLAIEFGCSQQVISYIISRKLWSHL
jgi:hypothetical protein